MIQGVLQELAYCQDVVHKTDPKHFLFYFEREKGEGDKGSNKASADRSTSVQTRNGVRINTVVYFSTGFMEYGCKKTVPFFWRRVSSGKSIIER